MLNEYKLILAPEAERDLDSIFNYITYSLQNPAAASNIIEKIIDSIYRLESMPNKHPLCSITELKKLGIRKLVVKNYIALYQVDEEQRLVKIITVFYGSKDYSKINPVL